MKLSKALFFVALHCAASLSYADSVTQNMQVSSTVNPVCTLNAQNMSVGIFTPQLSGFKTTSSSISVTCTRLTSYTIRLSFPGEDEVSRVLSGTSKGQRLLYDLFNDPALTNVMKDDAGQIAGVGTGELQSYTLYARFPNNQFVAEDVYINNLVVDILY